MLQSVVLISIRILTQVEPKLEREQKSNNRVVPCITYSWPAKATVAEMTLTMYSGAYKQTMMLLFLLLKVLRIHWTCVASEAVVTQAK